VRTKPLSDHDGAIRAAHDRLLDVNASFRERVFVASWLEVVFPDILERHLLTDDDVDREETRRAKP
jgi:hypothetical protein